MEKALISKPLRSVSVFFSLTFGALDLSVLSPFFYSPLECLALDEDLFLIAK